jgi:ribosomal protein L37E
MEREREREREIDIETRREGRSAHRMKKIMVSCGFQFD